LVGGDVLNGAGRYRVEETVPIRRRFSGVRKGKIPPWAANFRLAASRSCAAIVATVHTAEARVTKIKITRTESPTFEGRSLPIRFLPTPPRCRVLPGAGVKLCEPKIATVNVHEHGRTLALVAVGHRSFGVIGQYEKLVARVVGELDPSDRRNSVITDMSLTPRNARGTVEYETDIMILRPVDRSKGNHKVWYELTNRGRIGSFPQFNDASSGGNDPTRPADAGNGFLMKEGYSILISGWDTTAPPGGNRFTMKAPIAVNRDGSPIIGPSVEEFVVDDNRTTSGALTYPAATLDKSKATLTMRLRYEDQPAVIPVDKWDYADEAGTAIRLVGDQTLFRQGTLYEFVYQAKNPVSRKRC
jgi:hypothetical protein